MTRCVVPLLLVLFYLLQSKCNTTKLLQSSNCSYSSNSNQKKNLIILILVPGNAQLSKSYSNCKIMSSQQQFFFHWTVTSTDIEVAMQAPVGRGWLALGFVAPGTTTALMISNGAGTDVAIGYFREDDPNYPQGYLRDSWYVKFLTMNTTFVFLRKRSKRFFDRC
jgi:hypothetical protein